MENVAVAVEDEPPPGENLLGLYRGVPHTRRTSSYVGALPDLITIYRGPLERALRLRRGSASRSDPPHRPARGRPPLRDQRRTPRRDRQVFSPATFPSRGHNRAEVRRHLGRRPGGDQARRQADREDRRGGQQRLRGRLGDGPHDRRADRACCVGLQRTGSARDGHAADGGRADLDGSRLDGDQRPRPRGGLVHRLAGRDRHRHEPRPGADRRDAPGPRPRGARRGEDRDRRRLPGRLDHPAT